MTVCVDASLVVKLLLPEPDSDIAERVWARWEGAAEAVVAPALLDYEVASVLRLQVLRRRITVRESIESFGYFLRRAIHRLHDSDIAVRALEIATDLGQPRASDAAYLAVAERFGAPFWTADERLFNVARGRFPFIRIVSSAG